MVAPQMLVRATLITTSLVPSAAWRLSQKVFVTCRSGLQAAKLSVNSPVRG